MEWQKQHINLENVKEQYIDGEKFYQYTAIDEYSRLRYTWFTNAYDTYASSEFARRLVKYFPFKINENTLEELGLEYKVIKPHT
ncbi:MAG: hypothetical protein HP028_07375, partial [Clostridia bacterium]|nr:hypothetical protein [Clostridia bacterium]